MKTCIAITTLLIAMANIASADMFYLDAPNGRRFGPFEYKHGGKVRIGEATLTIVQASSPEQMVKRKMKSIKIPEIDFRSANIRDVMDFLREVSITRSKDDEKTGINIALQNVELMSRPLTLKVRNVSLLEAMDLVCQLAGLKWSVQRSVVIVEPRMAPKKAEPAKQDPAPRSPFE